MAVQPITAPIESGWLKKELAGGLTIQVSPDGSYAPSQPDLLLDRAGQPVFSLTLMLSRQPGPAEDSVTPLIQQGVLMLGLSMARSVSQPVTVEGRTYRPLFAQEARFSLLETGSGIEVGRASGMGAEPHASLSVQLSRDQAIGVVTALRGSASNLTARCDVRYRVRRQPQTIRLQGSWAAVYDALAAGADTSKTIDQRALLRYFAALVGGGALEARVESPDGARRSAPEELAAIFPRFVALSGMILRRVTTALPPDDARNVYMLRDRPDDHLTLDLRQGIAATEDAHLLIEARLEDVIGSLQGADWNAFVHLIGPTGALGGGLSPTPQRVRSGRTIAPPQLPMAMQPDRSVRSLPLMMRPVSAVGPPATAMVASDAAAPSLRVGPAVHIPIGDIVIDPPDAEQLRILPVVEDPASPVWHDRANPASYWYPAAFTVVQSVPAANPDTSPFLFTCVQTGATATGHGLDGSVRFTLTRGMSAAARAACPAGAPSQALPLGNLAISLELPFRDQDGTTKVHPLTGTVEQSGDTLTVIVKLLDDWVKLCYGALAYPNFQVQPARLVITYTYDAYVIIRKGGLGLAYGGKVAQLPLTRSPIEARSMGDRPYYDAQSQSLQSPLGSLRFAREAPNGAPVNRRLASAMMATALAKPDLEADGILTSFINRTHYAVQTLARQERVDVFFPCDTLGGLYQLNGQSGCQDAFKLDQTHYQLYEEIKELKHPLYQVFRSLQQPGLFLVLPAAYRITRFGHSEGSRAYRPAIAVYATIDLTAIPPSEYVVRATLQPDVPAYARRELLAKLESYALSPILQFPTEVSSVPDYKWLVGAPAPCK